MAIELEYSANSPNRRKVFVGIKGGEESGVSSMIRGAIAHHQVTQYNFETLEDLAEGFEGFVESRFLAR